MKSIILLIKTIGNFTMKRANVPVKVDYSSDVVMDNKTGNFNYIFISYFDIFYTYYPFPIINKEKNQFL